MALNTCTHCCTALLPVLIVACNSDAGLGEDSEGNTSSDSLALVLSGIRTDLASQIHNQHGEDHSGKGTAQVLEVSAGNA